MSTRLLRLALFALAVHCAGAIQHPIDAHVEALDPVRRGATVRLRVIATSKPGVARAEARLIHAGSARALGVTRQSLGPLDDRTPRAATFPVVVPASGGRALVQFVIEGEGPSGRVTRGVAFNLLPDGPTQIGRAATSGDGARVIEYEARRIEP